MECSNLLSSLRQPQLLTTPFSQKQGSINLILPQSHLQTNFLCFFSPFAMPTTVSLLFLRPMYELSNFIGLT
uniref:Uncharacterized protein n=1 Tax=Siphoviridae sp. ctu9a31 TaxID=2825712 RepID=A0A8S5QAH9_9CAUD|nr:MAG TPA: hypothetical protein [Siphoviridae sp. ctu9a31]